METKNAGNAVGMYCDVTRGAVGTAHASRKRVERTAPIGKPHHHPTRVLRAEA